MLPYPQILSVCWNARIPNCLPVVAILLDVQAVLAAAAEELDVDVPAPAEIRGGSGHLRRPRRTRARERFVQTATILSSPRCICQAVTVTPVVCEPAFRDCHP